MPCGAAGSAWATRIKNLAMALPSAAVITKKIIVPAGQTEDQLEAQVETEANQYIPFALEEVNLDFQILGPAPNSPEDVEVLIAASRKEKVEDRVAVAESVGLKAVVMDIDSFAAQTAFELMQDAAARRRPRPEHRDGRHRRVDDEHQRVAQRPVGLHARAAVRRQPAHPGNHAPLQPVRRRSRGGEAQRRAARHLRIRSPGAVHGHAGARSCARAAVLLHLDAVQPGAPHFPVRRLARPFPGLPEVVAEAHRRSIRWSPIRSLEWRSPPRFGRPSLRWTRRRCWWPAGSRCGGSTHDPNQPTAAPRGAAQGRSSSSSSSWPA